MFLHPAESFFQNTQGFFLLIYFRVVNIEQVLQLASVIPVLQVNIERNVLLSITVVIVFIKLKIKQQNAGRFNLLHQTIVACAEAVKFVLKAKPQSIVVDADHSIDLNPRDPMNHKV